MKKLQVKKLLMVAGIVAATSGLYACGSEEASVEKQDIVVEAMAPTEGELTLQNEFMGTITPVEEVYVVALVNAEVTDSHVSVGDVVSEGDLLCELDDSAAELQVKSANSSLATAKASKDLATGGQAEATNIQTEANIQTIKDNQAALQDKFDVIADGKEEIEKQMNELETAKKNAKQDYENAKATASIAGNYAANPTDEASKQALKDAGIDVSAGPEAAVTAAMMAQEKAKAVYNATKTAYDTNYPTLESKLEELKQSEKELQRSNEALQHSLSYAQQSYNLSNGQLADESAAVYQSQVNAAAVGVESAQYQQDMYKLTAPISGVVEAVNVTENSFVSSGSAAYVISNKDSMTVTFKVSEDIRNTFMAGEKIKIDKNGTEFEATITEVGQMVDAASGLFVIKGNVKASGNELLTGTSVKIVADTYNTKDGVLIPYDAIYYDNGQAYVYAVKEGKAVKTFVEVLLFDDTTASVTGITKEDKVITTWSPQLSDGVEVVVKEVSEETETEEKADE